MYNLQLNDIKTALTWFYLQIYSTSMLIKYIRTQYEIDIHSILHLKYFIDVLCKALYRWDCKSSHLLIDISINVVKKKVRKQ